MSTGSLIKDMPLEDRPRERLLSCGSSAISNEDLLAIILHTGTKNCSVKDLARRVLHDYGSIRGLRNATVHSLMKTRGISTAKSIALLASIELGKRVYDDNVVDSFIKITNSVEAYKYFSKYIKDEVRENFMTIFLDNQQKYIAHKIMFTGTINRSDVYVRDIIREALIENSNKLIIMHNHPSGAVVPSKSDDEVTKRIVEAASLLDIQLLDHIIVSKNDYYSYVEEGRLIYE